MNLQKMSNEQLKNNIDRLAKSERKITAEILEHIREMDNRRAYLEFGQRNMFSFLTAVIGYSHGAAQRRIEAARVMNAVPEVAVKVENGTLNLSQISYFAQIVREKNEELESTGEERLSPIAKKDLIQKIEGQDFQATQSTLARELNLKPKQFEKKRVQGDESLRLEITLPKDMRTLLQRAKDLLSNVRPNPTWAELFELTAKDSIEMRDPLKRIARTSEPRPEKSLKDLFEPVCRTPTIESIPVVRHNPLLTEKEMESLEGFELIGSTLRTRVPTALKRKIFERDRCCQWLDPKTGEKCASTFQLQLDHIIPLSECGQNTEENLQLLCSVHNKYKYQLKQQPKTELKKAKEP